MPPAAGSRSPILGTVSIASRRQSSRPIEASEKRPSLGATSLARAMLMLEARPGAFIFVGNGDTAGLHHPAYDFNDEVIPVGTSYWVKLVETALA